VEGCLKMKGLARKSLNRNQKISKMDEIYCQQKIEGDNRKRDFGMLLRQNKAIIAYCKLLKHITTATKIASKLK
jgi:hypothetical protein